MSRIIDLSPYCQYFWRSLEKLFRNKQLNFHMITTFSTNINLASEIAIQQTYFYHSSMTNFERFWQWNVYWHDSDWPAKSIWYNKPQNSAWETSPNRIFKEYNQLVWILFSRTSRYCRSCKSGLKILKNFMWCSARFNFRSSTVFDLCQWYEPSCRMRLVPICRWFMPALPA